MAPHAFSRLDRRWLRSDDCDLEAFIEIVDTTTDPSRYSLAESVLDGVVVYCRPALGDRLSDSEARAELQAEVADALMTGPGIVIFRQAVPAEAIDRSSRVFQQIIERQKIDKTGGGDHFAKPGANDRIWNALEKLALADPEAFCDYYGNDVIDLASEAWLGPCYQMTSQVNVVNPGGEAQQPHRDYHLGFMTNDEAERFPAHIHRLSPLLTLQGAVAHCDMPVETGPTLYLPHSQKYEAGYLAWRRPEFIDYFSANRVQLPLSKGDAVFFNPAVFHAAGTNRTTTVKRMANLLQVSSAMGRAMEQIDRTAMCRALYPTLAARRADGCPVQELARVIAASAEGYAFPADLDREQPVGGLAPPTQADLMSDALAEGWSIERLQEALTEYRSRRSR